MIIYGITSLGRHLFVLDLFSFLVGDRWPLWAQMSQISGHDCFEKYIRVKLTHPLDVDIREPFIRQAHARLLCEENSVEFNFFLTKDDKKEVILPRKKRCLSKVWHVYLKSGTTAHERCWLYSRQQTSGDGASARKFTKREAKWQGIQVWCLTIFILLEKYEIQS